MFRFSATACNRFTLAEILIMAAVNMETTRSASGGRVRSATAARQIGDLFSELSSYRSLQDTAIVKG
jgi:hypothetical protein